MPTPIVRSAVLPLLLVFAACKPAISQQPATSPGATASPARAQANPPACAETDFNAFLARFEAGAAAQREATADPLTMVSIDADAKPEPAPVTRQVPLAEVEFPLMFDAAGRQAQGLEMSVRELAPDRREVTVNVPDTGIQTRYEFHAAPCWRLVKVSDDTI